MKVNEQVVLVTGSSRGLGAAIAKAFGKEGARVVVNYVKNADKASEVVESIGNDRAFAIQADVRDEYQVDTMLKKAKDHFGKPVTTVVNNALVHFTFDAVNKKTADTLTWEDYQEQFEGSVKAALHTVQAAKQDMADLNFGRVINIGTNLFQNPVVAYHEYNTSKAALLGFTRNMARELGAENITVNMVSGGLLEKTDASAATPDKVFQVIKENTPLQKVTTPEDVADAVLFFSSPWSRAVTGQNLVVDGGLVMD
ncbi:3-oxoacyl-ACP reductase [Alteribacillus bidgolensis]|uniref:3-oxoacyl-[acyl-carrier protein] reductase n=1 Tax=Alteribacillus bidgolensis TaxID=930129 RepID=A0A1G8QJP7_9BACI|nr:3-oxoacyl-ACP reductase [Alteribacillus bidgolensis]SDJ04871.1 3-oxoacyl-[acyl-carrier protein] reductase [Alteribacillus bidgolensis]